MRSANRARSFWELDFDSQNLHSFTFLKVTLLGLIFVLTLSSSA